MHGLQALLTLVVMSAAGCASSGSIPSSVPASSPPSVAELARDAEIARRLQTQDTSSPSPSAEPPLPRGSHRIGPNDQLEVIVFEAPELNRTARVSAQGDISLPLLGEVRAAGLTPSELQASIEARLRERYILRPHVSVQITEIQSQPVSVVGAVNRPGIYQVRGAQTLIEVLALAGGLSEDAGERALVVRGGSSALEGTASSTDAEVAESAEEVPLRLLLETGDPRYNVRVNPGDAVKVVRAGIVYVVGEVREPGVFPMNSQGGITLLQAVALGKGLRPTAARGRTLIVRTSTTGERTEIRVDLGRVLAGKALDPPLQARDIVFVPNSAARAVALGVIDGLVRMVTLRAVF